jgi:23S rRNA G2069 N7-methylase RlmK/C1962 C5-methylase RlmI
LPLLKAAGVLLASSNTASWPPEQFVASIKNSVEGARRRIIQEHYFPQPPDFPISRAEPAYLKTLWLRVE